MKKTPEESKEECLLNNGIMAFDLGKWNEKVLESMDEYAESYHAQFEGECDFTKLVGKIETHIETTKECMDNFNTPDYVNELLKQDNQLFLEIINKIKRV